MKYLLNKKFFKNFSDKDISFVCKLIKKDYINHDTFIGSYESIKKVEVPISMHVSVISNLRNDNNELVTKRYTPIDIDNEYLNLMIKVYKPKYPTFPIGGRVSQYLDQISINNDIEIKYPFGKVAYKGNGNFLFKPFKENIQIKDMSNWISNNYYKIFFIAGGTGIAPIYQILKYSSKMGEKNMYFKLIYANKTKNDILLKNELENIRNKINFEIKYVCEELSNKDEYHYSGLITKEILENEIPKDVDIIMICGSKQMTGFYLKPILNDLGYINNVFTY